MNDGIWKCVLHAFLERGNVRTAKKMTTLLTRLWPEVKITEETVEKDC